jgi:hypothetical protein
MATKKPLLPYQQPGFKPEIDIDAHMQKLWADRIAKAAEEEARAKNQPGVVGDTARGVMSGLAGLVKTGGDLYGLASGDMDNAASRAGQRGQEYWEEGQSDELKRRKAERSAHIDAADGVLGKAGTAVWDTISDPRLALDTVATNATSFIPGAAAARGAEAIKLANAVRAGEISLETANAIKAGKAVDSASKLVAESTATLGTRAAKGAGAIQQGADVASNVYDASMQKTDAQWEQNPEYLRMVREMSGGYPAQLDAARQQAKHDLSLKAARIALPAAAAISVVANSLPGADSIERVLAGGVAKDTVKAGTKYALLKAIIKGAGGEALGEGLEEGGGQFAGNLAQRAYVDPNQDLSEKVGENAGMGIAGGILMGGGAGALHRQHVPHIQPESGVLSRAANAGQQATADKLNAQAAQAQVAPVQQEPIESVNDINAQPVNANSAGIDQRLKEFIAPEASESFQTRMDETRPASTLKKAQAMVAGGKRAGYDVWVAPHPSGEGYSVVAGSLLAPEQKAQYADIQQRGSFYPSTGSFSNVDELAQLAAQEKQDLAARRGAMASDRANEFNDLVQSEQQDVAQRRSELFDQQQEKALSGAISDTDARVQGAQAQEAANRRNAVLDDVLNSEDAAAMSPEQIQATYQDQLREQGFTNSVIQPEEINRIARYDAVRSAQPEENKIPLIRSQPNELVNAVPEKVGAAPAVPRIASPLPEQFVPMAQAAKNATDFWKALNKAKVPTGSRGGLMAAFKEFKKGNPVAPVVAPVTPVVTSEAPVVSDEAMGVTPETPEADAAPVANLDEVLTPEEDAHSAAFAEYAKAIDDFVAQGEILPYRFIKDMLEDDRLSSAEVSELEDKVSEAIRKVELERAAHEAATSPRNEIAEPTQAPIESAESQLQATLAEAHGRADARLGKPRVLPRFYEGRTQQEAQAWLSGWDYSTAEIEKINALVASSEQQAAPGVPDATAGGSQPEPVALKRMSKEEEAHLFGNPAADKKTEAQALNRKTVKVMTDEELRRGLELLPKRVDAINKEMNLRGLDAANVEAKEDLSQHEQENTAKDTEDSTIANSEDAPTQNISLREKSLGDVLLDENGTLYRIDSVGEQGVRLIKNEGQINERVVTMDQDSYDRLVKKDEAYLANLKNKPSKVSESAPAATSSVDDLRKALDDGTTVTLPSGDLVRITSNDNHGYNYAYAYEDMPSKWMYGAVPFIPGRSVFQSKREAIDKAVDRFGDSFKAQPASESLTESVAEPIAKSVTKSLADIMVLVKVTNADTGKTSNLKVPAKVALEDVDKRIDALENLLVCMKG